MTEVETGTGVRERDERDARFFAWDVPGDAHVVALVHERGEAERSATVADAIATSVARRREHTLLLSAEPGPSPLDELLGAGASEGLPAALEGRARLTDVAIQRVDRPFVYLPGGADPAAMRALLEDRVLASFVERVRERGGTLFIVLSEETLRVEPLRTLLDGYVALGDVVASEETDLAQFGRVRFDNGEAGPPPGENGDRRPEVPGLPPLPDPAQETEDHAAEAGAVEARTVLPATEPEPAADLASEPAQGLAAGRVDPPAPEPAVAARPVEESPAVETASADVDEPTPGLAPVPPGAGEAPTAADDGWKRHRKASPFPLRPLAIAAAAIAALGIGWWLIAGGLDEGAGGTDAVAAATPVGAPAASSSAGSASAFDAGAALAAFEAAPALGHSVMIASFAVAEDAEDRLRQIRAADAGFFFIAPTPVRGVLYYRIFAGALDERPAAESLMDDLVASGVKDEAGAWHIRPAALAFDLGLYPDRAAAGARVAALGAVGIPAYTISASGDEGPFRVYGGAYTDEREAGPMAEMLTEAGEPAELVDRRGSAIR